MRQTLSFAAPAALALALAAAAPPAAAGGIVFPPPGTNSFIQLYEVDSGQHVCQPLCAFASGLSSSVSLPSFAGTNGPNFITATGDIGPTALHSFVTGNNAVEYDLAMNDTYTVHGGGPGLFPVTAHMLVTGSLDTIHSTAFDFLIGGSVSATIGTFDIDPASTPIPIVIPFDPSTRAISGPLNLIGHVPQSAPVNLDVSYTRMVSAGGVFDIGYELSSGFALGTADVSHTASIAFDLPDDVFLTSAGGAEFGVPISPPPGVPEPASWALMIAGFGLAGAALRRRKLQPQGVR